MSLIKVIYHFKLDFIALCDLYFLLLIIIIYYIINLLKFIYHQTSVNLEFRIDYLNQKSFFVIFLFCKLIIL